MKMRRKGEWEESKRSKTLNQDQTIKERETKRGFGVEKKRERKVKVVETTSKMNLCCFLHLTRRT